MHEFPFKDLDKEGLATLQAISKADAFNEWMYGTIGRFMHGDILEIGSGIGNISRYFIRDGRPVTLSDVRSNYCSLLVKHYGSSPYVKDVITLDLVNPAFSQQHQEHLSHYDSVFALNVIEHIAEDGLALENAVSLLKPGGTLLILVPAYPFLYNRLDRELHHFRRYSAQQLREKMKEAGLEDLCSFYFNALGIPAWMASGGVFRQRVISHGQMKVYNRLVPVARFIDRLFFHSAGLSVIAAGRKAAAR